MDDRTGLDRSARQHAAVARIAANPQYGPDGALILTTGRVPSGRCGATRVSRGFPTLVCDRPAGHDGGHGNGYTGPTGDNYGPVSWSGDDRYEWTAEDTAREGRADLVAQNARERQADSDSGMRG